MAHGLLLRGQNWPLTVVSAVLGVGVVGALFTFAHMADLAAAHRERSLLENGVAGHLEEIARLPAGNTVWDEAVTKLDVAYDARWAQANVGEFFAGAHDFEIAAVIDRADIPVYAMRDGEHLDPAAISSVFDASSRLVEEVRAAEALRGPVPELLERLGGALPDSVYAHGLFKIDNQLVSITATLVQPDFGTALPVTDKSAIVITGEVIDQQFVTFLGERYLLKDARFVPPAATVAPRRAVTDAKREPPQDISFITWTPQRPGRDMLLLSLPITLLGLASLGLLALYFRTKGRQATERLLASEARASHMAYHDALTGLPNRLYLENSLGRALDQARRDGRPFAVHCIDLDRFKEVNDRFGQQAADGLILEVARLFSHTLEPDDTLARIGTDEFAVIQARATLELAQERAARFNALLAEPIQIAAGGVLVGCTVGVAIVRADAVDALDCLRQADLALNRARESGRGSFAMFEASMDAALRTRLEIRDELRQALANGELTLAYQPQVHQGSRMYGVEALARWEHPVRGNISPAVFIPIAEENGLIEVLGMFVLRRAFEDSKKLGQLRVAVNLSAAQFRLKTLVSDITDLIQETGVDPERIELEITEGLLLGDDPSILQTLSQLRALGFRISLDDFGTGYSSLSYLQRFPIDKIKIDRSFVANLGTRADADAVVSAIVRLARALRLDVIAEGVETELQRVRLAAAGCDDIQGYLFGKPMPLSEIEELLRTSAPAPLQAKAQIIRVSA